MSGETALMLILTVSAVMTLAIVAGVVLALVHMVRRAKDAPPSTDGGGGSSPASNDQLFQHDSFGSWD